MALASVVHAALLLRDWTESRCLRGAYNACLAVVAWLWWSL